MSVAFAAGLLVCLAASGEALAAGAAADKPASRPAAADGELLLAKALAWLAPAPAGTPREIQLKRAEKIVAIGDSITQGGGGARGYLGLIDAVLARNHADIGLPKVVNAGKGGHKAEDLIARFDGDVLQRKPDVVLLNVGINDVWHRLGKPHDPNVLAAYRANVDRMIVSAQRAGARVVLLSPTIIGEELESPRPDKLEGNRRVKLYVRAMRELGGERKCTFVDLHELFLAALRHRPEETPVGKFLTNDGVHPNANGYAVMAVGALRALGVSDEAIARTKTAGK